MSEQSPPELFLFCPRCGRRNSSGTVGNIFACADCGLRYYFNPTVAVAVFIERENGDILLIRRGKEPARGKLAPPGGFVDIGETAEDAVRREIREEVGLDLKAVYFLCSAPNRYDYGGVRYPVLDFFFTASVPDGAAPAALEEVESFQWVNPREIKPDELAFQSMRAAFAQWREGRTKKEKKA